MKTFWSHDSDLCNVQMPIVKNVQEIFGSRVIFEDIKAEENQDKISEYNIKEFPTIIIELGGKERERFIGLTQERFLRRALKRIMSERYESLSRRV